MPGKPSLFIVSNRLPITIEQTGSNPVTKLSSGGLVTSLRDVHSQPNCIWVGHCGLFANETDFEYLRAELAEKRFATVPLTKKSYTQYYNGISNNTIWPLFHYFPNAMRFNYKEWNGYRTVNQRFAEAILERVRPGDRVWIHDYQLMLLPRMLREAQPELSIAYFHHIPFPSSEVFRIMPMREELLEGLLGAGFIGFHTYDYVRHFLSSVGRILGNDIHVDEVHSEDRLVKVGAHPIGVDFEAIQSEIHHERCHAEASTSLDRSSRPNDRKSQINSQYLLLGIDRLDYTKGIPERLQAFREFLRLYPDFVGKVTLIQLCVPTRSDIASYGNLRATVERLVGQINGEFGRPDYAPIHYLYRSMPFSDVVSLYRSAHVALVTPLRDGLNLVSKEYAAARDDGDGVLIISELAGAASEMGEALTVNPYDILGMAHAIHGALTMPQDERYRRMSLLHERVKKANSRTWAKSFLSNWENSDFLSQAKSEVLTGSKLTTLIERISKARRCFVFLDNDGTLIPIAARPELAVPTPSVIETLSRLVRVSHVIATIVTGRPREYCQKYFVDLPIHVVAEHGAFVWNQEVRRWQSQLGTEEFEELRPDILKLLNMYTRFVPGTHVESKETSLVWHYRTAEPEFSRTRAMELNESLQQLLGKTSLSVFPGKKAIEVRQVWANKGYAVESILETMGYDPETDLMLTIGDDTTDEDMHRVYSEKNVSIHVGKPNPYAKYMLKSSQNVLDFVNKIIEHSENNGYGE